MYGIILITLYIERKLHQRERDCIINLFFEKWGFHLGVSAEELVFIKKKYKNTNILWSIDRRSYDWDYIK